MGYGENTTVSVRGSAFDGVEEVLKLGQNMLNVQYLTREDVHTRIPVALVPQGYEMKSMAPFLPPNPDRIRARVEMDSLDSFINYVNKYLETSTKIFVDRKAEPFCVTAVIDYHQSLDLSARWCSHVVIYTPMLTAEWKAWKGFADKYHEQQAFAEFIEEHSPDVVKPSGAEMLELAMNLEATRDVSFRRRIRLDNGDIQFGYSDATTATAGKEGNLTVPSEFEIRISPFVGMAREALKASFRYRLEKPTIKLGFKFLQMDEWMEGILETCMSEIRTRTKLEVFMGRFAR